MKEIICVSDECCKVFKGHTPGRIIKLRLKFYFCFCFYLLANKGNCVGLRGGGFRNEVSVVCRAN